MEKHNKTHRFIVMMVTGVVSAWPGEDATVNRMVAMMVKTGMPVRHTGIYGQIDGIARGNVLAKNRNPGV